MQMKKRLGINERAVYYQQQLDKSNKELNDAQTQLRTAEEK
jgi:hypothetical protein